MAIARASCIHTVFIVLLGVIYSTIPAQDAYRLVKSISLGTGYSENKVTCLYKDHSGFLWIGGSYGLYRYDGQRAINLNDMEGLKGKLSEATVSTLDEDPNGNLWIQTTVALYRFNQNTGELTQMLNTSGCLGRNTLIKYTQTSVAANGSVWFMCAPTETLYQLLDKDSLSRPIAMLPYGDDINVLTQLLHDSVEVYIAGLMEARIVKKQRNGFITSNFDRRELLQPGAKVYCVANVCESNDKSFVVFHATTTQLLVYRNQPSGRSYNVVSEPGCFGFNDIAIDAANNCWISAVFDKGKTSLLVYDPATGALKDAGPIVQDLPAANCLLPDDNRLLWMGTDKGVILLRTDKPVFRNYLNAKTNDPGDAPCSTRVMFQLTDSVLLLSTYKGNFLVNLNSGSSHLLNEKQPPLLYVIKRLRNGTIAAADYNSCLQFYNTGTNSFNAAEKIQFPTNIYCLTEDAQQNLWLAGFSKIYRIAAGSREVEDMTPRFTGVDLSHVNFRQLDLLNDSTLIISTNQGLFVLNPVSCQMKSFQKLWRDKHLQVPEIYQCYSDTAGSLWLATKYGGLQHVYLRSGDIESFEKNSGLNHDDVVSLLPDRDKNLWLGTYAGLGCFSPRTKQISNFLTTNGIANNEFNFDSRLQLTDGRLAFGTINGITVFDPRQVLLQNGPVNYHLVVTRLSVYDGNKKQFITRQTGVTHPEKIELFPFDRFFEIDAALLNYAEPEGHKFSYYLENFDDSWIDNGQKSTIRYTSLPAGQYRLHLKARDQRGIWSDELVIPVIVHEIFYKQIWFWLLCFVFALGIIVAFNRYRIKQINQLHQMRMKIAADLHDEVGSTLTEIAVQAELAQINNPQQSPAFEKIATRLQETVGSMRDVIWTVNAGNDTWGRLVARMEEHLYEAFTQHKVQTKFTAHGISTTAPIGALKRQHIFLLFKEAITNVIKHSNATLVEVNLQMQKGQFEMSVKNNGLETPGRFTGNGMGIESMKKRASEIDGNLVIKTENGFEVQLKCPVGNKA